MQREEHTLPPSIDQPLGSKERSWTITSAKPTGHLCYTSRLDSKGLDHHFDQAHPAQARDVSSQMHTTYADSRHGQPGRQHRAKVEDSTQDFLMLRRNVSERDRPTAQLQPARSQNVSASAANLIPVLLQPPPSQNTHSGYHTVKSLASGPPLRARSERLIPSPESPSCKRRRLSNFNAQHAKRSVVGCVNRGHFNDRASEDGDQDGNGDIPHGIFPASKSEGLKTMHVKPCPNLNEGIANTNDSNNDDENKLSPDAIFALEAGVTCEGEAQDRTFFSAVVDIVDGYVAAPSEVASNDGALPAMEMLMRRMFVKQVELKELMVELMELVRGGEPFEVRGC